MIMAINREEDTTIRILVTSLNLTNINREFSEIQGIVLIELL